MKRTSENKPISIDELLPESFPEFAHIKSKLNHIAEVSSVLIDVNFAFSVAFVEMFLSDTPNYELKKDTYGATRSNWTYHTALAMAQTCKMLNLTCKFEALGKRDAIIETKDETPQIILIAEWEWDYEDIFGKGKELEKLAVSSQAYETADAFLLIYCPSTKYINHLQRIAEYWIDAMKTKEESSTLFLHTLIFEERAGFRELDRLRTVDIHSSGINVWNDRYFN